MLCILGWNGKLVSRFSNLIVHALSLLNSIRGCIIYLLTYTLLQCITKIRKQLLTKSSNICLNSMFVVRNCYLVILTIKNRSQSEHEEMKRDLCNNIIVFKTKDFITCLT